MDQERFLWKTKPWVAEPWVAEQSVLMKMQLITWLEDLLLIQGGARQPVLRCADLYLTFKKRRGKGKPDPGHSPPPNVCQPRRKASPGARVIRQQGQLKH